MHLGSIYIYVKNYEKAKEFYSKLLGIPVTHENKGRFAMFEFEGNCLALMNSRFDLENPELIVEKGEKDAFFDDAISIAENSNASKVVFNFWTENLNEEYERIKKLELGTKMTKIRYICYTTPYYYFQLSDLDGNTIEVTGAFFGELE